MELSLRDMIALPTIRNTAGFDIIATTRDGTRHANIQVKSSGGRPGFWPICANIDNVKDGPNDCYALLRRNSSDDGFECYMLSGMEMKKQLEAYISWHVERGKTVEMGKFALCLYLDKDINEERTANWRKKWETWTL